MKAVICLALFAMGAIAQQTTYNLHVGYDTEVEADDEGGQFYGEIDLDPSDIPSGNGTIVMLRLSFLAASTTSNGATIKPYFKKETRPNFAAGGGDPVYPGGDISLSSATARVFNIDTQGPTGSDKLVAGKYYFGGVMNCPTCTSTGEAKIGAWIVWKVGGVESVRPFMIRDNSYTADYSVGVNQYGAAGKVVIPAGGQAVYIKLAPFSLSLSCTFMIVYKKGSEPTVTSDKDPNTKPDVKDSWYRFPKTTLSAGGFSTGGEVLAEGTWYIAPYVTALSSGRSAADFDFAVGLGHEPSAAGAAVPSFVLIVAAIVAALLAH